MRTTRFIAMVALVWATAGCESDSDGAGADIMAPAATLTEVAGEVFAKSCTLSSCHSGPKPAAGLSLEGAVHDKLVGVASADAAGRTLVVAGDPDESYLVEKLSTDTPAVGGRMPQNGTLDATRLALVRSWIAAGAKDD